MQATAAALGESSATATAAAKVKKAERNSARALSLDQRIVRVKRAIHRHRSVIRFYENHPRRLASAKHRRASRAELRRAHQGLAQATRRMIVLQRAVARRIARRLAKAPPKTAICHVFGRYCRQALAVSWCESRHSTTARNGQYLGLFQMGSYERQLFGHGSTARDQAVAAHKYFVLSGRDWSPWSCKPWYAT